MCSSTQLYKGKYPDKEVYRDAPLFVKIKAEKSKQL